MRANERASFRTIISVSTLHLLLIFITKDMLFATTLSALALAGVAAAQNVIQVSVGASTGAADIFVFSPPNVTANEGDVVMFTFSGSPGNHSVTQSSFTDPCDPIPGGFDTGTVFIPPGLTTGFPTWNLTVTNGTRPLWFFCKQLAPSAHCIAGMVGSINAATTGNLSFDAYVANAKAHQGNSGQSVGVLAGTDGASASALPGPLTGSISDYGAPSATAPGGASSTGSSGSTPAPTTTTSGALLNSASAFTVFAAALFGIVLA